MKNFSFPIRAVQLDLARQMETVAFLKEFIDFVAANGYNAVVFYLEGRVRTASFPYPTPGESYSEQEMEEVIAHARARGVEAIPAVSALGHAELFLRHPQMASLSETRPPFSGRFGQEPGCVFCPSQPGTYEFLNRYLAEIHRLFASRYFHAGCDEAWEMGRCDLCRARLQNGESQADLYASHLLAVHRIVTGQLGARMIVWDDMFEYYPQALYSLPRDIVMACWQYQDNVEIARGHFVNRAAFDALARYERLGFDFLICPADYTVLNAESFTAYAAGHAPLGGLLTTWEKSESFLLQSLPLIACVGRLWEEGRLQNVEGLLRKVVEDLFGVSDEPFFRAIEAGCRTGFYLERRTALDDFLTRGENRSFHPGRSLSEVLAALLPGYLDKIKETSRPILEEMILSLRSERAALRLDDLLPGFFRPGADAARRGEDLERVCGALEAVARERLDLWRRVRPGIDPCRIELLYQNYLANLRQVPSLAERHGILKVHFMLPDQYSSQTVRISIRYADSARYEPVATGVFKELRNFDCFYSRIFLIAKDRVPARLQVETWGFGGQGFTFFELENAAGRFVPVAAVALAGWVDGVENLLVADWQWAFAGERNTMKAYLDDEIATAVHRFEIELGAREEEQGRAGVVANQPLTRKEL